MRFTEVPILNGPLLREGRPKSMIFCESDLVLKSFRLPTSPEFFDTYGGVYIADCAPDRPGEYRMDQAQRYVWTEDGEQ